MNQLVFWCLSALQRRIFYGFWLHWAKEFLRGVEVVQIRQPKSKDKEYYKYKTIKLFENSKSKSYGECLVINRCNF